MQYPDFDPAQMALLAKKVRADGRKVYNYGYSALGFPAIGSGCSRVAFDLGNGLVAKVDTTPDCRQTIQECNVLSKFTEKEKKFILEPLAHDHSKHTWSVQQKVDRYPEWDEVDTFRKKLGMAGIYWCDVRPANMGWIGKKLVLFDYGVES